MARKNGTIKLTKRNNPNRDKMSRLTRRQVKAIKSKQKTKNDAKKWHIKNHYPVTIKPSIKPSRQTRANKGKQTLLITRQNKKKAN